MSGRPGGIPNQSLRCSRISIAWDKQRTAGSGPWILTLRGLPGPRFSPLPAGLATAHLDGRVAGMGSHGPKVCQSCLCWTDSVWCRGSSPNTAPSLFLSLKAAPPCHAAGHGAHTLFRRELRIPAQGSPGAGPSHPERPGGAKRWFTVGTRCKAAAAPSPRYSSFHAAFQGRLARRRGARGLGGASLVTNACVTAGWVSTQRIYA